MSVFNFVHSNKLLNIIPEKKLTWNINMVVGGHSSYHHHYHLCSRFGKIFRLDPVRVWKQPVSLMLVCNSQVDKDKKTLDLTWVNLVKRATFNFEQRHEQSRLRSKQNYHLAHATTAGQTMTTIVVAKWLSTHQVRRRLSSHFLNG